MNSQLRPKHFNRSARLLAAVCFGVLLLSKISQSNAQTPSDEICATLMSQLSKHTRKFLRDSSEWGARWKTVEGAKENSVSLFLKNSTKNPDSLGLGFVTRVQDMPANLKWYQSPVKRFARFAHVKGTEVITSALGQKHTPSVTYYPSLFNGLNEVVVNAPNLLLRPLTKALTGKSKELRLPYILGAYSFYTAEQLEALYQRLATDRIKQVAHDKAEEIDREMSTNFLYHDFWTWAQSALKDGITTHEKVRILFLFFKSEMDQYFSYMEKDYETQSFDEQLDTLLPQRSFQHIRQYIEESERGEPLPSHFQVRSGRNYQYNRQVVQDLIELNHFYLYSQALTPHAVRAKLANEKLEQGISLSPDEKAALDYISEQKNSKDGHIKAQIIDDILNTSEKNIFDENGKLTQEQRLYTRALFRLHSQGDITTETLIYRIQEDNYYRRKFREYDVLGVDLLVPKTILDSNGQEVFQTSSDGKIIQEVYTLEMQRRMNAKELTEQMKAKRRKSKSREPSSSSWSELKLPLVWPF